MSRCQKNKINNSDLISVKIKSFLNISRICAQEICLNSLIYMIKKNFLYDIKEHVVLI